MRILRVDFAVPESVVRKWERQGYVPVDPSVSLRVGKSLIKPIGGRITWQTISRRDATRARNKMTP